jgi:hypothetical protein
MRRNYAIVALIVLAPPAAVAQDGSGSIQSIHLAWRAGEYIAALEEMRALLEGPDPHRALRDIAELTGEWYRVREMAADGRNPRWSPGGRYASFEVGDGDTIRTHVVSADVATPDPDITLDGYGLTFAADAPHATYLRLRTGPELDGVRARVRQQVPVGDRTSFRAHQNALRRAEAAFTDVYELSLDDPTPRRVPTEGWGVLELVRHPDGSSESAFAAAVPARIDAPAQLVRISLVDGTVTSLREHPGAVHGLLAAAGGSTLVYRVGDDSIGVVNVETANAHAFPGREVQLSRDGRWMTFVTRASDANAVTLHRIGQPAPVVVARSDAPIANPAVSPTGARVAYQLMARENWEIWVAGPDEVPRRITYDVQHDLFPAFVDENRLLVIKGEGRHRRSYIYDIETGRETRLFHNNTVRTVAPEYDWVLSPDATAVLIVSERDGDTISPERALYLLSLDETVSLGDVRARVRQNLSAERDLRDRGVRMFAPIREVVADVVDDVDVERIYEFERDLFRFESKFITQPGNRLAIEYLQAQLRAMGYEPELQWFEPRPGIRSANVIATLRGTTSPDLTYVISSHFDSVERGPGADDNTSGTSALLEVARVMARHPMPTTIQFAFFTGEEAGLLGSREFVRGAVETNQQIVGALNNDMVGYANDERLDNTIRYSNAGIRDVQHSAAMLFADLITYDAKYYKSTDAHAYYEAYGDIVGGIGSYPILANPHYHQTHDVLETINHQLVTEVAKTTVASIMLLASSPARITDLAVEPANSRQIVVRWSPSRETGVSEYVIAFGPISDPFQHQVTTDKPTATLDVGPGVTVVSVKARNAAGLDSWDWARATLRGIAREGAR